MEFSYYTVLSNWLLGFDKYQRTYSKSLIKESSFPNEFYLLKNSEASIGVNKANKLLDKISLPGNRLLKITSELTEQDVTANLRNGKGWIYPSNSIPVHSVSVLINDTWTLMPFEEITAQAYLLQNHTLKNYTELSPRTLSILPVALACQARCWFCFSESSISATKENFYMSTKGLDAICLAAKSRGAERFVITGGGEPGLLKFSNLLEIISIAKQHFDKVVLITNGLFLSVPTEEVRCQKLKDLVAAGLTTLCLSRHSDKNEINKEIMGLDTKSEAIFKTLTEQNIPIRTRLICVLQKMGVHDFKTISDYLNFASEMQVDEVCFKELYVSSTLESLYAKTKENVYSLNQQVSLNILIDYLNSFNFEKFLELPWGSPVYQGIINQRPLKIAAYTEPSVGWERFHGIARSWNLMSDYKCYASLEDLNSEIKV